MKADHKKKIIEGRKKVKKAINVKRAKRRMRQPGEIANRKDAIRWFCTVCMGGEKNYAQEIRNCTAHNCPMFPWRLGALDKKCIDEKKGDF